MRPKIYAAALALSLLAGTTTAEAGKQQIASHSDGDWWVSAMQPAENSKSKSRRDDTSEPRERAHNSVGPRPSEWCGWWMRTQRGGGPEYNLAWTWSKYGSAASPQVGAVVVWSHHVGEITGRASDGRWIVRSGNDGGQVRERARSIAGAVVRI